MKKELLIKEELCPECRGTGDIPTFELVNVIANEQTEECPTCKGSGTIQFEIEAWEEKYNNKD